MESIDIDKIYKMIQDATEELKEGIRGVQYIASDNCGMKSECDNEAKKRPTALEEWQGEKEE